MLTAAGCRAGCTYVVRGLGKRVDVSFAFACDCPATVVVLHAESSSAAVLPPLAAEEVMMDSLIFRAILNALPHFGCSKLGPNYR